MLIWFGVAQVVWGVYYGVPIFVEPMKALAALLLAETITTGEFLGAGIVLGVALLGVGATRTLERVSQYIGPPVVRGLQLGVALVLLETGVRIGVAGPRLAGVALIATVVSIGLGYWRLSAIVVVLLGAGVAIFSGGFPSPSLPSVAGGLTSEMATFTVPPARATLAQLAMTVGNAALATSVLLGDYFDQNVSADDLSR